MEKWGEIELGSIMKSVHLTPLAGDTAKISLLALTELCPLPSVLFPLTRFDTGLLDRPWDAGTLVPALGHGDTMIHKHSANPFLPEQVPMGCPSYGSGSQQADEQVLSQIAERGWAQPQQGPAEPLGLNLWEANIKLSCPLLMPEEFLPGCLQGAPVLPSTSCNIRIHPFAGNGGGMALQDKQAQTAKKAR